MPHHTPLIATIVAGLSLAFVFGALAHRFRISPLVGYLVAGVIVGPFTPGYVADQELAQELAEMGVILLMFGVGLHFSLKDLLSVRKIAVPGALVQIAAATLMGMGLAWFRGWSPIAGFVFGLALSVASTVVLLRALEERRIVQTDRGRIAVGWLIVEDLAMVLALVMLPALAGALTAADAAPDLFNGWIKPLAITGAKVAGFVAFMLIVGRRVIPWVLHWTAHTGSRELFRLAVFAIALGVAFGAATLFDVSFALGAFFAGMILAESELSQRAAEETLPLRDAFAVLFFVSVGMLFNPLVVVEQPWSLAATVAVIVLGKSLAAFAIVRAFGHDNRTALTVSASLAQIGEFSFILATLGVGLKLMPEDARDLILGGAIISILLNPVIFGLALSRVKAAKAKAAPALPPVPEDSPTTALTEHVILVGYGRVGRAIAEGLDLGGRPFLVLEIGDAARARARDAGLEVLDGNAADPRILAAAGIADATHLIVAIPDGFEAGGVVQEARRCNPDIKIMARAHSDAEVEHLTRLGADDVVLGEQELADAMLKHLRAGDAAEPTAAEEVVPTAAARRKLILTDAEYALLAAVRETGMVAGQSVSQATLVEAAGRLVVIAPKKLDGAVQSLIAKDCLQRLDDHLLRVTELGVLQSAAAPEY
ncbi:YbaL family putative K(+) efflux transporter [Phenylobacterium sp.]|jgi:CPA2 family monovalent cation:H+ antiporter-2|uniref:YbaL family putative K(+) efflux transporter n=1 Tax=Phenylobacterium sp. TaxID=1871053 RepID=UPI0037839DAA